MNERIKLLESQCWEARQYGPAWFNSTKFAESIVRECISMADDFECDVNQRGLVDRMKQHFGVK